MIEKELLALKQKIDDAKTQISELTGQKQAMMKQLKEDFDCKSVEEADEKLKAMQAEATKLDLQIKKELKKLKDTYTFEFNDHD